MATQSCLNTVMGNFEWFWGCPDLFWSKCPQSATERLKNHYDAIPVFVYYGCLILELRCSLNVKSTPILNSNPRGPWHTFLFADACWASSCISFPEAFFSPSVLCSTLLHISQTITPAAQHCWPLEASQFNPDHSWLRNRPAMTSGVHCFDSGQG